ncbi:MAG: aspartyl/asparaginyl beta-hydroxylase domain-containing protein [Myxococcota bacterium]
MDAGRRALNGYGRLVARHSRHGDQPFFEPQTFPWVAELEAAYPDIRAELKPLLAERERIPCFQEVSKDQAHLTRDDRWKTYFLYAYGHKAHDNCARCPATTRAIERIPGMATAFFSILCGPKHIPAHRGPFNGVLRCHLAVKIPSPASSCGIRVHDSVTNWEEGRCLVFDDTYEHEAWNLTGDVRVVLFLDVLRPLPPPLSWVNRSLVWAIGRTPFVQEGIRNFERYTAANHSGDG